MVTIKQALTNKHSAQLCRTIASLAPGEAFRWVKPRGAGPGNWCVKLSHMEGIRVQSRTIPTSLDVWCTEQHLWTFIEGDSAGMIYRDEGTAEVTQS